MNVKDTLEQYFSRFLSLPWTEDSIPGNIVEEIISAAYSGQVLRTYDYVDVIDVNRLKRGWQVKSTKEKTPVTWKRAKIESKDKLIRDSISSVGGLQILGNEIIKFCNNHVKESFEEYSLNDIYYARCILFEDRSVKYFERLLATRANPEIFREEDFYWVWSTPKKTKKKEQLPALHGFRKGDGKKMWAWHGHGENQLHFSGESEWWNDGGNTLSLSLTPPDRMSYPDFFDLLP